MVDLSIIALDAMTAQAMLPDLHRLARDQEWMDWTDENYLSDLPDKWSLSRLITAGGEPVAYAFCSRKHNRLWLHRLAVGKDHRRQGIGETLMAELGRVARGAALAGITLKTPATNDGAIRFYTRNGFSICERQENLLVMGKAISITLAVHQPNYLPWLGYFYKIYLCDKFLFLDDAEASKGSYLNRSSIAIQAKPTWLSVPVSISGTMRIHNVVQANSRWVVKHIKTLDAAYGKSSHYDVFRDELSEILIHHAGGLLAPLTMELIVRICKWLGITTPFAMTSAFEVDEASDDRLIKLVQLNEGSRYLSGKGGANYQDPEKFAANGIELQYSSFRPVAYPQRGTAAFLPGLSVIDALANVGAQGVRKMFATAQASSETRV